LVEDKGLPGREGYAALGQPLVVLEAEQKLRRRHHQNGGVGVGDGVAGACCRRDDGDVVNGVTPTQQGTTSPAADDTP
jgi:hypothetical protein